MKKKYYLLELYPCGWCGSGNRVIAETESLTPERAVDLFVSCFPSIPLDGNCYAKVGEKSYCMAEGLS